MTVDCRANSWNRIPTAGPESVPPGHRYGSGLAAPARSGCRRQPRRHSHFWAPLRRLGCDVRTCNDPESCVDTAREFLPQLLFLDIRMPRKNGLEVAAAMRAANLGKLLIVARTGYTDPTIKGQCLAAGCDLVLHKPIGLSEMHEVLDAARRSQGTAGLDGASPGRSTADASPR